MSGRRAPNTTQPLPTEGKGEGVEERRNAAHGSDAVTTSPPPFRHHLSLAPPLLLRSLCVCVSLSLSPQSGVLPLAGGLVGVRLQTCPVAALDAEYEAGDEHHHPDGARHGTRQNGDLRVGS